MYDVMESYYIVLRVEVIWFNLCFRKVIFIVKWRRGWGGRDRIKRLVRRVLLLFRIEIW